MEFAKTVIGDEEINDVGGDSPTYEDTDVRSLEFNTFKLMTISTLPREVIDAGIEAYFDRFHWFVRLLHEPCFMKRASSILSRTTWKQDEVCDIILVLMVATLGLKCASSDPSWQGHQILRANSVTAKFVTRALLKEVGVHFYDILTQSSIEAYQIIMLLEVCHVYFGSLKFARHMAGVPARVAHGLGLHRDVVVNMDEAAYQVGICCWNHAVVGELFTSMIYGQPSTLDPAFSRFRTLAEVDETPIPASTAALPIMTNSNPTVSPLTFHILKFELYEVIQGILYECGALQLQDTLSLQDLGALIRAVESAEARLERWRNKLPAVFDPLHWRGPEPWTTLQAEDPHCTPEDRSCRRKLALQGIALQVLHDSAIILAHRPLLQCRVSVSGDEDSSIQLPQAPDSLKTSAEAALRISRRAVGQFSHQLALSFVFMHLFTAGVILCVPPINQPYSVLASESKAGVLRIISASRAMRSTNSIARHTDQVLTKLYSKTIQREMDSALRNPSEEVVQEQPHPQAHSVSGLVAEAVPHWRRPVAPTTSSLEPVIEDNTVSFMNDDYSIEPETTTQDLDSSTHPVVPYLQFSSFQQDETISSFLGEHLDETFAAFDQSK